MPTFWNNFSKFLWFFHSCYLVVALTHAIYPKLTPLLRARRKTESHAIAKTHTTNSKSQCARLIQHIHWQHQTVTKPCAHCVKHKENSFQLSHQRQQITLCTAHSAHQPLTSPSRNQTMRTLCRTPRKFIPTLTSHCARLIQHTSHWHHQVLTKPCAHCVEHQEIHLATFPLFLPQPQIIGKNTMFHDFPKISRNRVCFLLTLSLPLFYSPLLCFSSVHIVGLLTPKLRLNIYTFQSLPHSDWWQHLQPSPNTAGTQTLSTSYNIQKITKSTKIWQNPAGTQNGTSFGRAARVRAST